MEYIGIQKKNGGVVEALQQAILSGQIDVYKRQPPVTAQPAHCPPPVRK